MTKIIKLKPYFKEVLWGGKKLNTEFGYSIPSDKTGECWAVSARKSGESIAYGGEYGGRTLSDLWANERELFGNAEGDVFPLLVKIIDAQSDLSIQVHPDDQYAQEHENGSFGKTECWYILDCPENAKLVIGHNAKSRAELAEMINENRWDELIREVPVKKGDFIQIVPGTVHAIESGILLLEIQQNSDITYRVYDYDRLQDGKKRPLHIDKALDVIACPSKTFMEVFMDASSECDNVLKEIISCNCYSVSRITVDGKMEFEMNKPFMIASVLQGEGDINGEPLKKGDHFIIPSGYGLAQLTGNMEVIITSI